MQSGMGEVSCAVLRWMGLYLSALNNTIHDGSACSQGAVIVKSPVS